MMAPTAPEIASPEHPLDRYSAAAGIFDEMQSAPGVVRPHWATFTEALGRLGRAELASRWENGQRLIGEHGVTYNVYGDARGMERPWALDPVPLLIAAEDWNWIERGLIQRVRLLNLILADIYCGTQRLLRDGFLPPELIYANPGFLRPCHGFAPPHQVYLSFHASDLARSPDGRWWVLADRTQAPSGAGYALENRAVISRILPDELRACNVRRLGGFFRTRREMLFAVAPGSGGAPSGVLLTPGPHNETYFEHAYLARHLGFPLVEGADLTVRDRRVFLKTVEGLQPVDVILRRVDDTYCDPLELRGDSVLGVPGLVEAARAGNVTISNALGTGLLESPAFLPFLPVLCRHLLGEDLIIPSVATWWCGQAAELRYVLENLDRLVIKSAFGPVQRQPWFGGRLSRADRASLVAAIRTNPRNFIGQERVVLSRAPVWVDGSLAPRPVAMRAFVTHGGDSTVVLPGGLTRVSATAEDPMVSMQGGGGSKDTWVLAGPDAPARTATMSRDLRSRGRGSNTVPSRAADNLFWLGRYAERLEHTVRLLRGIISRLADESTRERLGELQSLPLMLAVLELPLPESADGSSAAAIEEHVLALLYGEAVPGSVRDLLGNIHLIASKVRDRFSGDTWRVLGRMERDARTGPGRLPLTNAISLIHRLVLDLAAFSGLEMENMTRGHGWRMLDLGRRIERAGCVAGFLGAGLQAGGDPASAFEMVLELADSTMTYRRLYYSEIRPLEVLELLLRDDSNPRSVAFQVGLIATHLASLPGEPDPAGRAWHEPVAQRVAQLRQLDLAALMTAESAPAAGLLTDLQQQLSAVSDELTHRYFSHTVARLS
jgi:uncharacterized circularly permuted ATP-grasp superfamily protein/uncharacterized alpha-E superfamily protein